MSIIPRGGAVIGTREKILEAAAEIVRDDGERPSVRAVAARAGVGASTLRHYFPTQRALIGAVLTELYTDAMPDARIRDTTLPARDRLLECLWALLEPFGSEEEARQTWKTIYETVIAPEASDQARENYMLLVRQAERRVESWLAILDAEGALVPGDIPALSRFLLAIIDGVSLDRAMMTGAARLEYDASTLRIAVDAVLVAEAGGGNADD
ncbi:TetR/AcrR family transcriptional regulator [Microbacterium awajiense]|uniref:TetR/AcrR family transcriptional regulator n=1 Tax=Microbacterium awajiense TaxID=415214 RepID=UPI0031D5AC17